MGRDGRSLVDRVAGLVALVMVELVAGVVLPGVTVEVASCV
jgi:hypothetical protein